MFQGIGFSQFRSFGAGPARLGPLAKVSVIAGRNNVGKSNVVRYLASGERTNDLKVAQSFIADPTRPPNAPRRGDGPNRPRIADSPQWRLSLPVKASLDGFMEAAPSQRGSEFRNLFETVVELLGESYLCDSPWIWLDLVEDELGVVKQVLPDGIHGAIDDLTNPAASAARQITSGVLQTHRGISIEAVVLEILRTSDPTLTLEVLDEIGPNRAIGSGADYNQSSARLIDVINTGDGLARRLAAFDRPVEADRATHVPQWEAFQAFVRDVLEDDRATIEVADYREIQVDLGGRGIYQIENLGTGIAEVIMLGAVATLRAEPAFVAIEEPELHLHPTLLRRLIDYLNREPLGSQFLLTTHSPHILDMPEVSVFKVTLGSTGESGIEMVRSSQDRFGVVGDLGLRASDLVQANAVIWVEGPSDRTYINHWISMYCSEYAGSTRLIEGVHYSVVPYGGALIAYLSADDSVEEEDLARGVHLIQLRRLNQHVAVVADSDRLEPPLNADDTHDLKPRLRRMASELTGSSGFLWITNCCEVENYVPIDDFRKAAASCWTAEQASQIEDGPYVKRFAGDRSDYRKPQIAAEYVRQSSSRGETSVPDHLDLRARVHELVNWIRAANHLPPLDLGGGGR